ncbi:hypothetical protein DAPPUDRAFT_331293 [Daphnia pulex]|uniref:Uncharacterized protein n=1 Tax=Daphnia pulex TaxID=6669 RepID=E9HM14_DAPPU|nr:hypothetical protein DAPPUDRAFT_331293 [Daphnia pulex]|eukprot:EFX67216.1 hypothetical protein DAPPUDRAFT_331293 [Daphnia pulex]
MGKRIQLSSKIAFDFLYFLISSLLSRSGVQPTSTDSHFYQDSPNNNDFHDNWNTINNLKRQGHDDRRCNFNAKGDNNIHDNINHLVDKRPHNYHC